MKTVFFSTLLILFIPAVLSGQEPDKINYREIDLTGPERTLWKQ